ncbi:MAG: hypothetical protein M1819_003297 [Sarea resinae]|nr:MAG: hypothetical protein M1819_003297 [Sarea resinae]
MANGWSIIIGLVIVVILSFVAWFFSPKGDNQTVWRSTLILSFASCYLMWAAGLQSLLSSRNGTLSSSRDELICGRSMRAESYRSGVGENQYVAVRWSGWGSGHGRWAMKDKFDCIFGLGGSMWRDAGGLDSDI